MTDRDVLAQYLTDYGPILRAILQLGRRDTTDPAYGVYDACYHDIVWSIPIDAHTGACILRAVSPAHAQAGEMQIDSDAGDDPVIDAARWALVEHIASE